MCCDFILQKDFHKTWNIDKLSITMIILCKTKGKHKNFNEVLVGCQRMMMMIFIIYKVEYIINL